MNASESIDNVTSLLEEYKELQEDRDRISAEEDATGFFDSDAMHHYEDAMVELTHSFVVWVGEHFDTDLLSMHTPLEERDQ